MSLGDAVGKEIKVDEVTLEIGYYASVLVEVDLSNTIPHHVLVKSKYGSFEQEVQIPKLPSFCNHCKVVGHLVTEYRLLRKENEQSGKVEENQFVVPKKVWRRKTKKTQQQVEFDICSTSSAPPPEMNVGNSGTHNVSNSIHEELLSDNEIVDVVIPPIRRNPNNSDVFFGDINSNSEFPELSVERLLYIANSIPPIMEGTNITQSGREEENLETQMSNGGAVIQNFTALGSPSKFNLLVDVVEEHISVNKGTI